MSLDTAFLTCLKEIEVSYVSFPKSIRLRIERWVEKLVVVGQNIIWKKHRNMYARLLLGMILSKTFSDPFDINPPDGSLPPFPSHLKIKLKNISGPHESTFWRDIYHRIPDIDDQSKKIKKIAHSVDSSLEEDWRYDMGNNEIESLRQLIEEQSRRIEILEHQITTERKTHELEIMRFMEHHRGEINKLRKGSQIDHLHHLSETNNDALNLFANSPRNSSSSQLPIIGSAEGPNRSFRTVKNLTSSYFPLEETKSSESKFQINLLSPEYEFDKLNRIDTVEINSIPEDDTEFLRYLEEFQTQLRTFR